MAAVQPAPGSMTGSGFGPGGGGGRDPNRPQKGGPTGHRDESESEKMHQRIVRKIKNNPKVRDRARPQQVSSSS
jgi:hypothetical protein